MTSVAGKACQIAATLLCAIATTTHAGTFPEQPVKIVLGFGAGSASDTTMRLVGEKFQKLTGQPLIVEPRPGAAGNLATGFVAKSKPDGYTVLMGSVGMLTINGLIYPASTFDVEKDLMPVVRISSQNLVLVVNGNSPAKNLADFINHAKENPEKLSYASYGAGSESHFLGVLFNDATGARLVHVPYKGSLPAITDLLGGHVTAAYMPYGTVKPYLNNGRLKALAVASSNRTPLAPDVPTFKELGYPALEAYAWSGLAVPAGTPESVRSMLHDTVSRILAMPDVKRKLEDNGHEIVAGTTAQFKQIIQQDRQRWAHAIKISNFSLDK